MKARRERAEAVEPNVVTGLRHARASGQRSFGPLDAQLHEVLMRREPKRCGELAREVSARQASRACELVERRSSLQLGVKVVARSDQSLQNHAAGHAQTYC